MEQSIASGRGGKGTIYVWAGGNGRRSSDNCNYDGYANLRYTIAVGGKFLIFYFIFFQLFYNFFLLFNFNFLFFLFF